MSPRPMEARLAALDRQVDRLRGRLARIGDLRPGALTRQYRDPANRLVSQLTGESFRELSVRLADSPLLQRFIQVGELDGARPPSKSTLERYEKEFKAPAIEKAVRELVQ